jgi:N-acetyl-gamma-glutamyl-phosphate reductase
LRLGAAAYSALATAIARRERSNGASVMISCAVIGATGYAGAELSRLLASHPEVGTLILSSASAGGEALSSIYPNLIGAFAKSPARAVLVDKAEAIAGAEVVFAALPSGHAEEIAAACAAKGSLFIDLSADFRFGADEATYSAWYGKKYARPELHAASVYGLPELNRERIRALRAAPGAGLPAGPRIIGNPGCYPTASTLGLFPALRLGLAEREGIIIDAKSGVTGAGKEPAKSSHYSECADSISPYKIGEHRHIPEIDAVLASMAGAPVDSVFTPHLAPMGRGIVATIYFRLAGEFGLDALRDAYSGFYAAEPFVRVLPAGLVATNRNVRLSNYCDISVHLARGGRTAIVVSAIDNMVKGAAGQAVQNMNAALGLDEGSGIAMLPPAF